MKFLLFDTSLTNIFPSEFCTIIPHTRILHFAGKLLKNSCCCYSSKILASRSGIFLKNLLMSTSNSPQLHSSFSNRIYLSQVIFQWVRESRKSYIFAIIEFWSKSHTFHSHSFSELHHIFESHHLGQSRHVMHKFPWSVWPGSQPVRWGHKESLEGTRMYVLTLYAFQRVLLIPI